MKYLHGVLTSLAVLAICAVVLNSWTSVAVFLIISVAACILGIFNRLHPEHKALPTADDILKILAEHQTQTSTELERLRALIAMGRQGGTRMLRE